jgi:hypothetical protein
MVEISLHGVIFSLHMLASGSLAAPAFPPLRSIYPLQKKPYVYA